MNPTYLRLLTGIALVLAICGCQNRNALPPITKTPSSEMRHGQIVWHELVTDDVAASVSFYKALFGWQFEPIMDSKPSYTLISMQGKPIGGIWGVKTSELDRGAEWVQFSSVSDIEASAEAIRQKGGELMGKITRIAGRGQVALVADAQGAVFGLIQSDTGDPLDAKVEEHEWLWAELWANDPEAAGQFYRGLGYELRDTTHSGLPYTLLYLGGEACGAITPNPVENVRSHWVPYIRVADPASLADQVDRLGGRVLLAPTPEIRNGKVGVFLDPRGAPFVAQVWPM